MTNERNMSERIRVLRKPHLVAKTIGLAILLTAVVPASSVDAACPQLGDFAQTAAAPEAVAHPADPNSRPDLFWPVVSVTQVALSDDQGRPTIATVTVRENPVPQPHSARTGASLPFGSAIAVGSTCTFDTNPSVTIDTPTANGYFIMHMTDFYDRWVVQPGNLWSYVTWQTNVWWTRWDPNYDVYSGQQSNNWNYYGADCSDVLQHYTAGGGNWAPNWPGSTGDSTTYVYNGPMNTWPVIVRPASGNWLQYTNQFTTVAYLGSQYTTLSNSYTPPNRIP